MSIATLPRKAADARANNVRALREAAGLTLVELAERMDPPAHFAAIQKIETGKQNLTLDYVMRISKALGVDPAALLPGVKVGQALVDTPVLGAASAGRWQSAKVDEHDTVLVLNPPKDGFAVRAEGDSMNLLVPDGGYVVVAPHERELLDGKVYVVMKDDTDEATVKRFRLGSPPVLEPCSTNPEHRPMPLGADPIRVIGRVTLAVAKL